MIKKRFQFIKKTVALLLSVSLVAGMCGCAKNDNNGSQSSQPTLEAKVDPIDDNYRVMYEIFTGSFADSNGDGTGDLLGIMDKLDYLNDGNINSGESLGIQGIWLTPIFSSPSYHKYDVQDYYSIDKNFGTESDLQALLDECHKRNVILILDLVINHTSTQHQWFKNFVEAHKNNDTEDPYYDFYTWAKKSEVPGGRTFNRIAGTMDEYYECNFSSDMPELNYDNETVRQEMLKVAKHYIDLGVDGFRFDAIKYIYYGDTAKSVDFWNWYCKELKAYKNDIYMVGECWDSEGITLEYVKAVNCFNFQAGQPEGMIASVVKGYINTYTNYIENYQDKDKTSDADGMMINFLSNHDLDRAAGYMTVAGFKAHMAANLLILCSGSPFLYYGEEIGMRGTRGGSNTDANRRLAMLWGDGNSIMDPVGADYDSSKQTQDTVEIQVEKEDSLFNHYRKVIEVRNRHPEIARGEYKAVSTKESLVGGFEITYKDSSILLLHNVDADELTIDLSEIKGLTKEYSKITDFVGIGNATLDGTKLTIGGQTSVVIE